MKWLTYALLGASLASEFSSYRNKNIWNIRSIDTSNPVVAGIKGIRYNGTLGLKHKDSTLLADLIKTQPNDDQMELINYNIAKFREIVNG